MRSQYIPLRQTKNTYCDCAQTGQKKLPMEEIDNDESSVKKSQTSNGPRSRRSVYHNFAPYVSSFMFYFVPIFGGCRCFIYPSALTNTAPGGPAKCSLIALNVSV
ncbi:hypothetical protein EVAR_101205_1 [Eumeta japonica]|uniref:Uncharacterized protein n=1 Tax=Eumeta variegata TaxID=151549 RepID=A0A4C2AEX5_EUMVA|nr:hypothetical protein EVAR_101205_1 [Eumeta japonica]